MEYPILILIHLSCGVVWAGGLITVGFFVVPAVFESGPAGGAVIAGIMRRRFATLMTAAGALVVVSGLRLYMLRFSADWIGSANGIVLTLGALLGLAAFIIGVFVQKPTATRFAALGAKLASSGDAPSAEEAAELEALRVRLAKIAKVSAWHVLAALLLMAAHRLSGIL